MTDTTQDDDFHPATAGDDPIWLGGVEYITKQRSDDLVQAAVVAEQERTIHAMPRYFGVWSATGVHVGVWEDGKIAADILSEYPGGTLREMVDVALIRKGDTP